MVKASTRVRVILAHAETHFREGSKEIGTTLVAQADRDLDNVSDPVEWAFLYSKIEKMVAQHVLELRNYYVKEVQK